MLSFKTDLIHKIAYKYVYIYIYIVAIIIYLEFNCANRQEDTEVRSKHSRFIEWYAEIMSKAASPGEYHLIWQITGS